jgi:hypothetical protein
MQTYWFWYVAALWFASGTVCGLQLPASFQSLLCALPVQVIVVPVNVAPGEQNVAAAVAAELAGTSAKPAIDADAMARIRSR